MFPCFKSYTFFMGKLFFRPTDPENFQKVTRNRNIFFSPPINGMHTPEWVNYLFFKLKWQLKQG